MTFFFEEFKKPSNSCKNFYATLAFPHFNVWKGIVILEFVKGYFLSLIIVDFGILYVEAENLETLGTRFVKLLTDQTSRGLPHGWDSFSHSTSHCLICCSFLFHVQVVFSPMCIKGSLPYHLVHSRPSHLGWLTVTPQK